MRILYISSANFWGGATKALFELAKYFKNHGDNVLVYTTSNEGKLIDMLNLEHINWQASSHPYMLTRWPNYHNPFIFCLALILSVYYNYQAKKHLKKIVKDFKPDIVHTNVGPLNIALEICKKLDIIHVWHLREYQDLIGIKYFPTFRSFKKDISTPINYNIAITKGVFDYYNLDLSKDRVIYDGVFSEKLLPSQRIVHKDNYILFVGRIEPMKDPLSVIMAFHRLIEKYKLNNLHLKLAGAETNDKDYKKRCVSYINKNNLSSIIEFLGHREDVYDLMKNAKCLVVSSISEGFGFISVEAMLNYCPVIGKYTGGIKEQFDNGEMYEHKPIALKYETFEQLVDKMHEILTTDTTEMVERAYRMVTTHYTNELCGRDTLHFYQEILSRKR